jgi:hypothetical protein
MRFQKKYAYGKLVYPVCTVCAFQKLVNQLYKRMHMTSLTV